MTNNRPNAPADDFAFWKRVILILFMNSFVDNPDPLKPEEKLKNVNLGEQLKEEAPQILNWMIEGSLRYQREGLIIPDFIADSVSEYREEVDTIGQYILDRCLVGSQHSCPANRLYVDYSDWCEVNGYRALSSKNFGLRLKKRFSSARRSSGVIYEGVDLQQDTPLSRRY
jgi:putative DNA primase/helicase